MRRRREWTTLILFCLMVVGLLGYTFAVGNKPALGLDLKGGISATLQPLNPKVSTDSVKQAKQIIANRVNGLGVSEPEISQQGRTIVVDLPGVKDPEKAKTVIGRTAKMEFRPNLNQGWQAPNPTNPEVAKQLHSTSTTVPGATPTTAAGGPPTTVAPAAPGSTAAPATTAVAPSSSGVGGQGRSFHGATATSAPAQAPPTTAAPTTPTTAPAPATTAPAPATTAAPPATAAPTPATPGAPDQATQCPAESDAPPTTAPSPLLCAAASSGNEEVLPAAEACLATVPQSAQATADDQILPGTIDLKSKTVTCYLLGPVGLEGEALSGSQPQLDSSTGQWVVGVGVKTKFESKADDFMNACYNGNTDPKAGAICPAVGADSTTGASRGAMAIILDGQVLSSPTVNQLNLASNANGFVIQGNFTSKSASELSLQLRYGALPVTFKEATFEKVSATLGANSLHAGLVAGLVGLALVALYMIAFYRLLGLVAIASLFAASGLLWVVIAYLGVHGGLALTLAGITGIIVSVGVAVDSNVVCFEHLREDTNKGRTLRSTADRSFKDAWRVIVSADLVSLIGAALLYWFTVGSVRGFAFYLGLSTILDLVASWFLMRPAVMLLARSDYFQTRPKLLGVIHRRPAPGPGTPRPSGPATAGAGAGTGAS